MDNHTLLDFGGAGSGVALATLDFHQADPAGSERIQAVGRAEFGYFDARSGRGLHHRGTAGDSKFLTVYRQGNDFADFMNHRLKSSGKCLSALRTG